MPFRFQKAFHFDRGHTTSARRSDGLAVCAVLDVAGVKNARDIRACPAVRNDIAIAVQIQLRSERLGVRNVPNGYKKAIHFLVVDFAGLQVSKLSLRSLRSCEYRRCRRPRC